MDTFFFVERKYWKLRAFSSKISKKLAFSTSKIYFINFNDSLSNNPNIKDFIFFTASLKYYFFYYLLFSFSSLSLQTNPLPLPIPTATTAHSHSRRHHYQHPQPPLPTSPSLLQLCSTRPHTRKQTIRFSLLGPPMEDLDLCLRPFRCHRCFPPI